MIRNKHLRRNVFLYLVNDEFTLLVKTYLVSFDFRYKVIIKMSSENKITAKNSWELNLIDHMGQVCARLLYLIVVVSSLVFNRNLS